LYLISFTSTQGFFVVHKFRLGKLFPSLRDLTVNELVHLRAAEAYLEEEFDGEGESRHVHGILPVRNPAVIKPCDSASLHDRRTHSRARDESHWKHSQGLHRPNLSTAQEEPHRQVFSLVSWLELKL